MNNKRTRSSDDDIIKNATHSFKAEGFHVTKETEGYAREILSGRRTAASVIDECKHSLQNKEKRQ